MNFLTDFCLPALVLSSAALVSLGLMGETSLRFRTSLVVLRTNDSRQLWRLWHEYTFSRYDTRRPALGQFYDS